MVSLTLPCRDILTATTDSEDAEHPPITKEQKAVETLAELNEMTDIDKDAWLREGKSKLMRRCDDIFHCGHLPAH